MKIIELRKQIRKTQATILKLLEKEVKLVTKNHYRNTRMAIGMIIGLAIGAGMDKKAVDEGRQINLEIKY